MVGAPPEVGVPGPLNAERRRLERADFPRFLARLTELGYRVVGPTVRDGAIVYGEISSVDDLPIGWTERQEAGQYRLERRKDEALFGYVVGPHSWKKYLFPARERLWTARRTGAGFEVDPEEENAPPLAFLGMRACEIAAIGIQDRVFDGAVPDPGYHRRRASVLRVAVECGQSGGTCFCVSMGTGPAVSNGFDLRITELLDVAGHRFLIDAGTPAGARVLEGVPTSPAPSDEVDRGTALVAKTAASMGRRMPAEGLQNLMAESREHPRWELVAQRCLSCTNCTMVCPTCFCNTTEDVPDLSGSSVERWRRWDSCFNSEFSKLHTQSVRKSTMSRYRQWLTHKLGTWHDQFDVSGCVGCGRCITWCPVGIDLTEEVAALRVVPAATPVKGGP
ncbi:MAG TPA: 4Fe-4S dicluster domain-containing protein [Thermoplasmata archaeon]|nr:4Fe-4S dicluster domain-containing protein [Thermoplasmata archaeon]